MSSEETLKEPEWRGRECLRAFNEQKVFDERLSTIQVTKIMIDADLSRQKRKQQVDKLAAVVILQSYLDSKKF